MKNIVVILLLLANTLPAQEQLPEIKNRWHNWVLDVGNRYYLGEQIVEPPAIRLHLKEHNEQAFQQWRTANKMRGAGYVAGAVGFLIFAVGLGVSYNEDPNRAIGIPTLAIGTGLLVGAATAHTIGRFKRQRAIIVYNQAAGY